MKDRLSDAESFADKGFATDTLFSFVEMVRALIFLQIDGLHTWTLFPDCASA